MLSILVLSQARLLFHSELHNFCKLLFFIIELFRREGRVHILRQILASAQS
jgi:hypothetical protein